LDLAKPTVADRGHGFDVAGVAGVVAEEAAEQSDAAGEGVFGDRGIAPHRVEKFLFGDQLLRVTEQDQEHAKGLGFDGRHFARLREQELALANFDVGEAENKGLIAHHFSTTTSSTGS